MATNHACRCMGDRIARATDGGYACADCGGGLAPFAPEHRYTLAMAGGDDHYPCAGCGSSCHPRSVRVNDRDLGGLLCDDCAQIAACDLADLGHVIDWFSEYLWHALPEREWLASARVMSRLLDHADHRAGAVDTEALREGMRNVVNGAVGELQAERGWGKAPVLAPVLRKN